MTTTAHAPTARRVTPTGVLLLPADAHRSQWLELRRLGITATDLPKIVGASKYGSAADVYAEKIGQPLVDDVLGEAGKWGVVLEDIVARTWASDRGVTVRRVGLIANTTRPWQLASLDRTVTGCRIGGRCGVEVKTRSHWALDDWLESVPDAVNVQVQWQLDTSGFDHMHAIALIGGQRLVHHVIAPDGDVIAYLREQGRAVWDAVQAGTPPVVDPALLDIDLLNRIYPTRAGVVELDNAAQARELLAQYAQENAVESAAKKAKERLKVELLAMLGTGEEATAPGGATLFTYRPNKAKSFIADDDVAALAAALPDAAAKYTRTVVPTDIVDALIEEYPDAEQFLTDKPGPRVFRPKASAA